MLAAYYEMYIEQYSTFVERGSEYINMRRQVILLKMLQWLKWHGYFLVN